ncbi:MAG: hypothetical protein BGO90_09600 [Legionella sp. 40-6]|nr:cyclic nucleotide-binding domain-containing protein [Legionella sp.]OJY43658.1 MAG: hypothetical protein BGO90_09600 [Legionella sp. 40-6]
MSITKQEEQSNLRLEERKQHFNHQGIFCLLPEESIAQLALLAKEINVAPDEIVASEGELLDGFFLIVSGEATVTKSLKRIQKTNPKFITTLGPNESIDLVEAGFQSTHGIRSGTVTATSPMVLLYINLFDFYHFLKNHETIYPSLKTAAERFLLLHLIYKTPFYHQILEPQVTHPNPKFQISEIIAKDDTEQMIFQRINDKKEEEEFVLQELVSLTEKELQRIAFQVKALGITGYGFILPENKSEQEPETISLMKKIAHFWKGKARSENK